MVRFDMRSKTTKGQLRPESHDHTGPRRTCLHVAIIHPGRQRRRDVHSCRGPRYLEKLPRTPSCLLAQHVEPPPVGLEQQHAKGHEALDGILGDAQLGPRGVAEVEIGERGQHPLDQAGQTRTIPTTW